MNFYNFTFKSQWKFIYNRCIDIFTLYNIDAPIIDEFPLTLECKVIDIQEELGDYRVVAEIINTLVDERVLNEKGEIDVDKLELITFDSLTNSYRILGEKVGQAFKDGAKIK